MSPVAPGSPTTRARAALAAAVSLAFVACAPPAKDDPDAAPDGPHPVAVTPEDGAEGVRIDAVVRVRMSDHLDGRSVRSGRLRLASGPISMWLLTYYDPVREELVAWPAGKLRKHALWTFEIEEGVTGLEGDEVPPGTVSTFQTGEEAGDDDPFPVVDYETAVAPVFSGRCASCHGGPLEPLAGLDLSSPEGVSATLLGADADGWPGWKRAVPGRPGQSYLLYKLLGDPRIAGARMPRSLEGDGDAAPLGGDERRAVADWLASGAGLFDSTESDE